MKINVIHKEQTDEQLFQNIKKAYKKNPNLIMHPDKWKKLRLAELKRMRKKWSN